MRLQDLTAATLSKAATYRWDRIIEKHEGPEDWEYLLRDNIVEFIRIDGFDVLLPVDKENHVSITIERCIVSSDRETLTVFLNDSTCDSGMFGGYMAICEKVPNQDWYIAIVYHECWINRLETTG